MNPTDLAKQIAQEAEQGLEQEFTQILEHGDK